MERILNIIQFCIGMYIYGAVGLCDVGSVTLGGALMRIAAAVAVAVDLQVIKYYKRRCVR